MLVNDVKEVKTCSKCSANKNKDKQSEKSEKTCKTCKENLNKFVPYLILSFTVFGFAVYGVVTFVKDMISLFSK
jgi:hypothetical protein